jgi:hypothetical protein
VPWLGLDEQVELRNHGESNEYVVTWQRRDAGVIVPDSRTIGVDAATGLVFRYLDVRRPYKSPGQPAIDEKTAVDSAVEVLGEEFRISIDRTELRLAFDARGSQYLVWLVYATMPLTLDGSQVVEQHVIVEVDTATGKATVIATG